MLWYLVSCNIGVALFVRKESIQLEYFGDNRCCSKNSVQISTENTKALKSKLDRNITQFLDLCTCFTCIVSFFSENTLCFSATTEYILGKIYATLELDASWYLFLKFGGKDTWSCSCKSSDFFFLFRLGSRLDSRSLGINSVEIKAVQLI